MDHFHFVIFFRLGEGDDTRFLGGEISGWGENGWGKTAGGKRPGRFRRGDFNCQPFPSPVILSPVLKKVQGEEKGTNKGL